MNISNRRVLTLTTLLTIVLWISTIWILHPQNNNYNNNNNNNNNKNNYNNEQNNKNNNNNELKFIKCNEQQQKDFRDPTDKKIEEVQQQTTKSTSGKLSTVPQIVHLDLKGAPPRMSYLLKLLPVLKKLGATGLLVEYEDMFPYHGTIRKLSSPNAYSYQDIEQFLAEAHNLNMDVIPLLPTLGHLELLLKHSEFKYLRENEVYANSLCPLHEESLTVVKKMIEQVC